jgi:hypothetical protein
MEALSFQRMFSSEWFSHSWSGGWDIGTAAAQVDPVWTLGAGVVGDAVMQIDGLQLDTAVGDNDVVMLAASGLAGSYPTAGWDSDREPGMWCSIVTGIEAHIHNVEIAAGIKLTAVADPDTDADQAIFSIDAESATTAQNWICRTSVAGVDNDYDTGIVSAPSTLYKLGVFLDEARRPHFWIGDRRVWTGPALQDLATYDPMVGFANAGEAAQKIMDVRHLFCCQRFVART